MDKQAEVLQLHNQANTIAFQRMNVPKLYQNKRLSNFAGFEIEKSECVESIVSGKSVYLSGHAGTGKTHLAVGLIIEWLKKNAPQNSAQYPLFLPAVEFFLELKGTFNGTGSEKEVLDKYSRTPLLCIDDIGAEKISDWSRQMFYTLIDRRYRDEKQTIITSNLKIGRAHV